MEECHSDMVVSEIQKSVFFRKLFLLAFVTSLIPIPNPVKPQFVDESFIRCHGWLGYLGDSEWRTEADNRVHRERNYDGAVFSSSDVDIRRKRWRKAGRRYCGIAGR